jgi:thiamine pyrophosphate-dependent acetolactate synthase large subunit-like protein
MLKDQLNRVDSAELDQLRRRFKAVYPDKQAAAYELGVYARRHGITITDYGAHSKRWVKRFLEGCSPAGRRNKVERQLILFNP